MVLTKEDNDLLTQVGRGTPGGELLRRYWMPVAIAAELTPEQPTRLVRLLGETLVLFRDQNGRVGLLEDRCAHRGASLFYGRVEPRGISCAYHGWLYDTNGKILETPPERNEAIINSVRQPAYAVRKYVGMYWAYLGPEPVPELPPYDTLVRRDGKRRIVVHPVLDCNWYQAMENSVDSAHLQVLHQEFIGRGRKPINTTRGFTDDVASEDYYVTPIGIMKKRTYKNGQVDEHPLVFPNILRQGYSTQIRVPLDDTHTAHIHIMFEPNADGSLIDEAQDPSVEYLPPYKDPPNAVHPNTRYTLATVLAQDHMAWETQGPIADRTIEHLSYSDRGIHLFRKVTREQIARVQAGDDPMGVVRDAKHPMIDTNIEESTRVENQRPVGIGAPAAAD